MGLQCTQSGALVAADDTDGNGVLYRPCTCGRTVVTDDGPTTALRVVRRHPMFPTRAGQLGSAEALLAIVADRLTPAPGGLARVVLPLHTAERIKSVVDGFRTDMHQRASDHESLPIDAGVEPW